MGLLEGPVRAIALGFQKALAVRAVRASSLLEGPRTAPFLVLLGHRRVY